MASTPAPRPRLVLASRGDALTAHLFAALADRNEVVATLTPRLTRAQLALVAATTFRPSRRAWSERFFKSGLGHRLRTRNAGRQLRALDVPAGGHDAVLQVHNLFDVDARTVLYVDCTHRQSAQHWPAWNPLRGKGLQRWYEQERREYRGAAHVFAYSRPTFRSLVEDYGVPAERVSVVGAGANTGDLDAGPPPARGDDHPPTVLFVGNDFVRKGGEVLLAAFERVRAELPHARLQVVGTRHRLPQQDGVEVLGRLHDRRRLAALFARADVFALPSFFEPYGLAILEAMAFGLPVVSTPTCGVPEVVQDGVTGLLVPAGDPAALADRLLGLLRDPAAARAMGAAGRARVQAGFTWAHVADRMAPALQRVAAGAR